MMSERLPAVTVNQNSKAASWPTKQCSETAHITIKPAGDEYTTQRTRQLCRWNLTFNGTPLIASS